jgi:hypothetical protein
VLQQQDRRDLERAGWRTTLDYRENHRRGRDGQLLQVTAVWHAEAERAPGGRRGPTTGATTVIWAEAGSVDAAWARLRLEAELAGIRADPGRPAESPTVPPPVSPTEAATEAATG